MMKHALPVLLLLAGCATAPSSHPGERFWSELNRLCGNAYEGKMVEGTEPSDAAFGEERMVMHVRSCSPDEIRIPFLVGENRSRTWVISRTADGLRLKHDHRHEDGSTDEITQYGGDTRGAIESDLTLDFFADAYTARLIPAARTNIWSLDLEPGTSFTYGLRRDEQGRRFRVEFDLTRTVAAPPAPW